MEVYLLREPVRCVVVEVPASKLLVETGFWSQNFVVWPNGRDIFQAAQYSVVAQDLTCYTKV